MSVELKIYHCAIPLIKPYHLAFNVVTHFDSFFAKLTTSNGVFWGETTALPGYSWETPQTIWKNLTEWGNLASLQELNKQLQKENIASPFAVSCINTAIEKSNTILVNQAVSLPLVGIISSVKEKEIEQQIEQQLKEGYTTIKVKVQGNIAIDKPKVEFIQQILPSGIKIRIDANQSYHFNDAAKLVSILQPEKVELFEQPFAADVWLDMVRLNKISPVPLMLDESIWTEKHLKRTAELNCAAYVKLKMFKHGGIANTKKLIKLAQDLNLKVVFGNGVQSDIGCYDEAILFATSTITTAGELNGYLKQTKNVTTNIKFEKGILSTVEKPKWTESMISKFIQHSKTFNLKLS